MPHTLLRQQRFCFFTLLRLVHAQPVEAGLLAGKQRISRKCLEATTGRSGVVRGLLFTLCGWRRGSQEHPQTSCPTSSTSTANADEARRGQVGAHHGLCCRPSLCGHATDRQWSKAKQLRLSRSEPSIPSIEARAVKAHVWHGSLCSSLSQRTLPSAVGASLSAKGH